MRESHESAPGGPETSPEAERRKNKNRGKKVLAVAAAVGVLAAGITIGTIFNNSKQQVVETSTTQTEAVETFNPYAGELTNGVHYDYSHYADRHIEYDPDGNMIYETNKESWNAYDYDMSERYGDREATTEGILEVAERSPEALASYAYNLFTDEEKAELGIDGMLIADIDDYMSNDDNPDGGVMQGKLQNKLEQVLNSDLTHFQFYKENSEEETNYIYFVDDNKDGAMTPDELHLGYDTKKRDGAEQVDIVRSFYVGSDKDSDHYARVKMLDLNMACGFQPNYTKENLPQGLPHVPSDADPVRPDVSREEEPSPDNSSDIETPTTQTGKQGDPHGGDRVTPSEQVNPSSEVTREQNDKTNTGNQGYIDDHKAKPGDASTPTNNGGTVGGFADSGIVAPGATTDGGRLQGGENQGTTVIAGENPYYSAEAETSGNEFDQFGNDAQAEAQNNNNIAPGGNNNSDQEEEDRFAAGDF